MKKEKVYTICYNTLDVFNTKEEAKKFYTTCFYSSEGVEQQRYASILVGLNFKNIAYDNVSDSCNEISIKLDKYKDKYLKLKLNDFLSIHDTVELYEKLIKPILEVSDEYDIDFNKKIPFETFGADNEINMSSFSEYYKDLCRIFKIEFNKIETKEFSDGKYNLYIDDEIIDIRAWDNLQSVIDNVKTIIEIYKKKYLENAIGSDNEFN